MTARTFGTLALALALAGPPAAIQGQTCDGRTEQRLEQESYIALTDRVYVHAPDVPATSSGGWQPFDLRVLVGSYRAPLLLPRGLLKPADLATLLSSRPDIKVMSLSIPGHDGAGRGPSLQAAVTVPDGERPRKITIRATRVVAVSGGTDHLFLVCTAAG